MEPTNPFERRSEELRKYHRPGLTPQSGPLPATDANDPAAPRPPLPAGTVTVWPLPPVSKDEPRTRLVVACTANICRSPMVGGILQRRFEEAGLAEQVEITSAGVYGLTGEPASQPGVELLAKRNIDISGHVSRPLEDEEILDADLVIVMEESHRQVILASLPAARYKIVLFSELAALSNDMEDPYRKGPKAYRKTLATIDSTLDAGWNRLLRRLQLY